MFLPVGIYKNILRLLGALFICAGILFGYSAFEAMFDPSATIALDGAERNDPEAKMINLVLPVIFLIVGLALVISKGETLANFHKAREHFWSIFNGK